MIPSASLAPFSQERLITFLEGEMGLDLSSVKLQQILEMVLKSGAVFANFEDYSAAVASMISVHETYFLRHNSHYEWLEKTWLPNLLQKKSGAPVRLLSAGCSSGEEPYSLYAHLAPIAAAAGSKLQIVALDISKKSLAIARSGKYGLWSLRGVAIEEEQSWLDVKARSVYVKEHIKNKISFDHHNLCRPLPFSDYFDLILCRNVLIYMHRQAIDTIYNNLALALSPEGCLIPGPSDPNPPPDSPLSLVWQEGIRCYYKQAVCDALPMAPACADKKHPRISPIQTVPVSLSEAIAPLNNTSPPVANQNHGLIETLIRSGHYDLARKSLETNIQNDKFDVRSYIMLAVLALDLDEIETAREAARKASFLEPDSPYTVYTMSDVKNRMGDKKAARNDLIWVKNTLNSLANDALVKYCEEINIGQLKAVVESRLLAEKNLIHSL